MPSLLQQQIQLGLELRRMVDDEHASFPELIDAVLEGREDWDDLYAQHVDAFQVNGKAPIPAWFRKAIAEERAAYTALWNGDYERAGGLYDQAARLAADHDPRMAAWLRHWQGLAHQMVGDEEAAAAAYIEAANERAELGRPEVDALRAGLRKHRTPGWQATRISEALQKGRGKIAKALGQIRGALKPGPKTNPVEQALKDLGRTLGLASSRPDDELGTGPDILWLHEEKNEGIAFEAKTNKRGDASYSKRDIGQCHDHIQWLSDEYPGAGFRKVVVGPVLPVSTAANPPDDLEVMNLEQFVGLCTRLEQLLAETEASGKMTPEEAQTGITALGLDWPRCVESLESRLAVDLKSPPPDSVGSGGSD
jgi:tetratricopeptide (TPR) repeat protein